MNQKPIIWKVSNKERADYIRAATLDEAKQIFDSRHYYPATTFQPCEETNVQAVYFTDSSDPAFFKGTKAQARAGGQLYIRQWQLTGVTIDRIETI